MMPAALKLSGQLCVKWRLNLVKAEALESLAQSLAQVADRLEEGLDIEIQGKNPE